MSSMITTVPNLRRLRRKASMACMPGRVASEPDMSSENVASTS
ncbi:MAG TPA: hypothetical protein PKA13_21975 [Geminicoccaceae bacterium]|nr:hypothetical protein [Geminicoccaceae bacterium]